MAYKIPGERPDDAPDTEGWDRERDGWMADYQDIEPGFTIEPYNPDKDPVNQGIVPSPYEES